MAQPIKTSVGCQSDRPRAGGLDCNGRRNLLTVVPTIKNKAVGVMAATPARVEIPARVADPIRYAILHVDPERFPLPASTAGGGADLGPRGPGHDEMSCYTGGPGANEI
jgi:hypothetical protein